MTTVISATCVFALVWILSLAPASANRLKSLLEPPTPRPTNTLQPKLLAHARRIRGHRKQTTTRRTYVIELCDAIATELSAGRPPATALLHATGTPPQSTSQTPRRTPRPPVQAPNHPTAPHRSDHPSIARPLQAGGRTPDSAATQEINRPSGTTPPHVADRPYSSDPTQRARPSSGTTPTQSTDRSHSSELLQQARRPPNAVPPQVTTRPPDAVPAHVPDILTAIPALTAAVEAAQAGEDITDALDQAARTPGCDGLRLLSGCWRIGVDRGGMLTTVIEGLADALRDEQSHREEVTLQLAGPRATARLLAVLPLLGLAMAVALGAHPFGFLFGTLPGLLCLSLGVALDALGMWWTQRLTQSAEESR